jgi:RHS repeat-associated protein
VGKIQQVNDPTGTYAFAYDNMGRLIGTTTSYSFLTSRNFTNAYTYDAASNRTGFTDPESGSTGYTYDTLNRLTSLAPPSAFGSGSFGFTYDALSRRTQMTRPNSVTTNYTYDNLSRLTSVLHQLSGSTIDGASYTLDSAGNRTAKTDQRASSTSNYTYDAIYQLTQVTQANNTTESYAYDAVGNRTASLGVSSYTTNASNELTATSNASYTYDSNGNTLTKAVGSNTTSYAWDYENRLTSVTLPGTGGTVTFKYDPQGNRIQKVSPAAISIFAYDGANLIEETNTSGAVVARYSQTDNIDEPLAMLRSGATSYYNADGLGSVTSLTNSSGAAAETYTYDSFGKATASSGSLTNSFQYTGRELDSETGLYYYRARYYDAVSGRFMSEDPIGFSAGGNFYRYVGNHSTDLVDPSGLLSVCCRPAHNGPAEYWAQKSLEPPPCHCFPKLSDNTTLGGYHHNWPWSGTMGGLDLRPNDASDHDKYAREASCTFLPGKCDGQAMGAFNSSPKDLGGYGFGSKDFGTSNDAASKLLKDSGIGYTLPACAWGKGTGTVPSGAGPNPVDGFPIMPF